jgi:hypothetical protein
MQQDPIIQAVHPVLEAFLLELFLLEVEHLEVLEVEHLEVLEVEHLEVEHLEVEDQDYHPLVVILETIFFLRNNTRKNLVTEPWPGKPPLFMRGMNWPTLLLNLLD